MKTKPKPRARRMWANAYETAPDMLFLHASKNTAVMAVISASRVSCVTASPVAVIPLNDVNALVQLAAEAYFNAWNAELATRKQAMRAALTAIGVLPKQRKGGAK